MRAENKRQNLRHRTKQFALRVIKLYRALPLKDRVASTSVAAQYREACRAKSDLDFISKVEGALQELDETELWLELLVDADVLEARRVALPRRETNELIAMFVTMSKNVKARRAVHPSSLRPQP
jgi:four helix bundle protein